VKAKRSNSIGSPIGGVVPILKKIQDAGIPRLIRKCLGDRVAQAQYQYHDAFTIWTLAAICGCKRIEQITKLKKKLEFIPHLKVPSHDTVGRIMKKLSTSIQIERAITRDRMAKINHTHYNENINLNRMLIQCTKAIGALKENISYTLDFDATYIECLRRGSLRPLDDQGNLKNAKIGVNPMVCLIGNLPVFISMRNASASPSFKIHNCVENCLRLLDESKIKIGRVVSDAAGFNKVLMAMLDNRGIKFNIRFIYQKRMHDFNSIIKNCTTWKRTEIETANHFWDCEIADISYTVSKLYYEIDAAKTYRVVAVRIPTKQRLATSLSHEEIERRVMIKKKMDLLEKKRVLKEFGKPYEDINWKELDGYLYKFYITNDFQATSEEIVKEYNKRGNSERKLSFMKNDFSWNQLPFDEMNHNTVFLIAAALANNIFRGVLELFRDKVPGLRLTNRLPEFRERFVNVACAYIRNRFVFFSQDIFYDELII